MHADQKNLTHEAFNAERVMRWHPTREECGPKLVHLEGKKNAVAHALSRVHPEPKPKGQHNDSALEVPEARHLAESFLGDTNKDDSPEWIIPVSCKLSLEEQRKDSAVIVVRRHVFSEPHMTCPDATRATCLLCCDDMSVTSDLSWLKKGCHKLCLFDLCDIDPLASVLVFFQSKISFHV